MTDNTLSQVYEAAKLQYTPQQISVMLALDPDEVSMWMHDRESAFFKEYWRGYYETDLRYKNSVYKLSFEGSSPAQNLVKHFQEQNSARRFYE